MTSTSQDRRLGVNSGMAFKVPVKAATTGNITLSGEQTIDGVSTVTGDRVLVKDQTTGTQNGIYVVDTGSWTRDIDFDGSNDVVQGTLVLSAQGTVNAGVIFKVTTANPVIGTSSLAISAVFNTATVTTFGQTLLDDTSASQARSTLGVVIGTNVQAHDADLDALAALTSAANKVPMFSGSGTATLLDFKDEDNMASDSATAVPSQQSVKAYVDAKVAAVPQKVVAWVNFNGTGTVAIRSSYNVTSITDNGTGDYTVNFTSALADANYAFSITASDLASVKKGVGPYGSAPTSSAFRLLTVDSANNPADVEYISAVFFR